MGYERTVRINHRDDGTTMRPITEDEWALIVAIRESGRTVKAQPNITADELETLLALRAGTARVVPVPQRVYTAQESWHGRNT